MRDKGAIGNPMHESFTLETPDPFLPHQTTYFCGYSS